MVKHEFLKFWIVDEDNRERLIKALIAANSSWELDEDLTGKKALLITNAKRVAKIDIKVMFFPEGK